MFPKLWCVSPSPFFLCRLPLGCCKTVPLFPLKNFLKESSFFPTFFLPPFPYLKHISAISGVFSLSAVFLQVCVSAGCPLGERSVIDGQVPVDWLHACVPQMNGRAPLRWDVSAHAASLNPPTPPPRPAPSQQDVVLLLPPARAANWARKMHALAGPSERSDPCRSVLLLATREGHCSLSCA